MFFSKCGITIDSENTKNIGTGYSDLADT